VHSFFSSILSWFISPFGLLILAALDSSMLFFLPAAVDITVIVLAARQRDLFWAFPLLATAGSLSGAYVTFMIGRKIGEKSLTSWLPGGRGIGRVEGRIRDKGAVALAIPGLLPPPFPLTPFILACGALKVSLSKFMLTLAAARLVRFGLEASLAAIYGSRIVAVLESDAIRRFVTMMIIITVIGSAYTIYRVIASTRHMRAGRRTGHSRA
jgi:membrane protein YqaA with SNARE-associated domain